MPSEGPKMSKRGTTSKQKHLSLTIPQELEINWSAEYSGS
jgi:hypothetical protein